LEVVIGVIKQTASSKRKKSQEEKEGRSKRKWQGISLTAGL
jgi:hypothetical protein